MLTPRAKKARKTSCPNYHQSPESADRLILDKLWEVRNALLALRGTVTESALNQSFRSAATMIWEFREHTKHGEGRLRSIAAQGRPPKELVLDHVFPIKLAAAELFAPNLDRSTFEHFMRTRLVTCLITKIEHAALESPEHRLKQRMPEGWDGLDVFARYDAAGIKMPGRG